MMKQAAGELGRVSSERLRDELFKILDGPMPDASMRALEMLDVFPYFLPELALLKDVEQPVPHIQDVWAHTLAVLASLADVLTSLKTEIDPERMDDTLSGQLKVRLDRYREQFANHFAESLNADRSLRSLLFFAALYHDVSKPETKTIDEDRRIRFFDHESKGADVAVERARALNLSNNEIDRLHAIVKNHMRIHFHAARWQKEKQAPSRRAIYRFFRDSGNAGIDLILLALADLRAIYGATLTTDTWAAYLDIANILLENYWERPEEAVFPPRLLDGNQLMKELDLKPGPVVGQLLESVRENQAAGKIETREQAIAFARDEFAKGMTGES
jgi:putative nucleotidyltransferase with HDIG domain